MAQQIPHAADFIGVGRTILQADRCKAQLSVGNKGCHIDRRRGLVQTIEVLGDRGPCNWIIAAISVDDLFAESGGADIAAAVPAIADHL